MQTINNLSEIQIQAKVCQYFWNKFPVTRYCLYHVPNEGKRSVIEAMQQKASGLVPGIQDLHFVWKCVTYRIELKDSNGYISKAQKIVHAAHASQGCLTWVFYDAENCIDFIEYIIENAWKIWLNRSRQIISFDSVCLREYSPYKQFVSPYCRPEMLEIYINENSKKKR